MKMDATLKTIKENVAKYKALFAADGTIGAVEQGNLAGMERDVILVENRLEGLIGKEIVKLTELPDPWKTYMENILAARKLVEQYKKNEDLLSKETNTAKGNIILKEMEKIKKELDKLDHKKLNEDCEKLLKFINTPNTDCNDSDKKIKEIMKTDAKYKDLYNKYLEEPHICAEMSSYFKVKLPLWPRA